MSKMFNHMRLFQLMLERFDDNGRAVSDFMPYNGTDQPIRQWKANVVADSFVEAVSIAVRDANRFMSEQYARSTGNHLKIDWKPFAENRFKPEHVTKIDVLQTNLIL